MEYIDKIKVPFPDLVEGKKEGEKSTKYRDETISKSHQHTKFGVNSSPTKTSKFTLM